MKFKSKLANYFFSGVFFLPMTLPNSNWLNLKYKKIKANQVQFEQQIEIKVDNSSSPLFYNLNKKNPKHIDVEGSVIIETPITDFKNDSYFQIGIIYKGNYKPSKMSQWFFPEWLKKVLVLANGEGLGRIDFYALGDNKFENQKIKIKSLKMNITKAATIDKEGHFAISINDISEPIHGLWLRADGDESKAKFITRIKSIKITEN